MRLAVQPSRQRPFEHSSPESHRSLQLPQCFGSLASSTHSPPQKALVRRRSRSSRRHPRHRWHRPRPRSRRPRFHSPLRRLRRLAITPSSPSSPHPQASQATKEAVKRCRTQAQCVPIAPSSPASATGVLASRLAQNAWSRSYRRAEFMDSTQKFGWLRCRWLAHRLERPRRAPGNGRRSPARPAMVA